MQQIAAAALRHADGADLNALLKECHGRVPGVVEFGKPSRGTVQSA